MKFSQLSLLALFIFPQLSLAQGSLSDVNQHHFKEAVYFLQGGKIIDGYDDGTFQPDKTINRAEFLKIIIGAEFADTLERKSYRGQKCFTDIEDPWVWYVPYACLAKEHGIIKGYDNGDLRPSQTINFVEAAKIIANVYAKHGFLDESDLWYRPYVDFLLEEKLIPIQIKNLDTPLTRGAMAEMIARAIKWQTKKLDDYLNFRRDKYQEDTTPSWESFSVNIKPPTAELPSSSTSLSLFDAASIPREEAKVLAIPHPGEKVTGGYISRYDQWIPANYSANINNNKLPAAEETEFRRELFGILNQARASEGKILFELNSKLNQAAQSFAEHIVINAFYSHTDLYGQGPLERIQTLGYSGAAAESIVWRNSGPESALNWWKNSALHWKNISNPIYKYAGIGIIREPTGGLIFVLLNGA
jgi:uncharacterized protein YkwD